MRLRTPEKFNPLIAFDANGRSNDLLKEFHSRKQFSVLGGIAQLGERLNGIQEVSGSIPLISTKQLWDEHSHLDTTRGCFRFVLSNAHICRLNLKIPRREICGGFLLSWLLCAKIL